MENKIRKREDNWDFEYAIELKQCKIGKLFES